MGIVYTTGTAPTPAQVSTADTVADALNAISQNGAKTFTEVGTAIATAASGTMTQAEVNALSIDAATVGGVAEPALAKAADIGAVSGIASLDANSEVVQLPAGTAAAPAGSVFFKEGWGSGDGVLVANELFAAMELASKTAKQVVESSPAKLFHISIDDFYEALADITTNSASYSSIFDNATFAFLKQMHDSYNTTISCLCFTLTTFDISNTTTKFKSEFIANAHWLKFGFHGRDASTFYDVVPLSQFNADYDKFLAAVASFAGTENLVKTTRLSSYTGSALVVAELVSRGVINILAAHDLRLAYDLTDAETRDIAFRNVILKNDMNYVRSNILLEGTSVSSLPDVLLEYYDQPITAVFTHEYELTSLNVTSRFELACKFAADNGYVQAELDNEVDLYNRIKQAAPKRLAYTYGSGWSGRGGEFRAFREGNKITLQGQMLKSSAIGMGETLLTLSSGFPSQAMVISVCAFANSPGVGEQFVGGIPLLINTNGTITTGWRGVSVPAGLDTIGFLAEYYI